MNMLIDERTLALRINRKLRRDNERVRKCPENSRWNTDLGDWYLIDVSRNLIIDKHVDLRELAAEVGVHFTDAAITA